MTRTFVTAILLSLAVTSHALSADGRKEPVKPAGDDHPLKELWSGYHYARDEVKARQDKDGENPAMSLVAEGEKLWNKVDGKAKKSCASCHTDAAKSMKGAGARYPAWFELGSKPLTLSGRINTCRVKFMDSEPLPVESDALLALLTFVKYQSRGVPVKVSGEGSIKGNLENGRTYFTSKRGQLGLSCADCHDRHAGKMYRDEKLSQGHSNGFPAYKESWKKTGTLLRQVNHCLRRVRANPLAAGSELYTNLELYLAWRGNGLEIETPAVRK